MSPAARRGDPNAGDCVDCKRCVAVCPTGIDIRNGLQLECIGCTACIDACDEVMDKLERPRGLIRYDSQSGLEGGKRKILRPRVLLYGAVVLAWAVGAFFAFRSHEPFEANVLRLRGAPFVITDGTVRNLFSVHLVNKGPESATFHIEGVPAEGLDIEVGRPEVEVGSLEDRSISVFVDAPVEGFRSGRVAHIRVEQEGYDGEPRVLDAPILGPRR